MLDENNINERIQILDSDIAKVSKEMQLLDQKKVESTNLMNALMGAKQQCELFLKELNNVDHAVGQGSVSKKKPSRK